MPFRQIVHTLFYATFTVDSFTMLAAAVVVVWWFSFFVLFSVVVDFRGLKKNQRNWTTNLQILIWSFDKLHGYDSLAHLICDCSLFVVTMALDCFMHPDTVGSAITFTAYQKKNAHWKILCFCCCYLCRYNLLMNDSEHKLAVYAMLTSTWKCTAKSTEVEWSYK